MAQPDSGCATGIKKSYFYISQGEKFAKSFVFFVSLGNGGTLLGNGSILLSKSIIFFGQEFFLLVNLGLLPVNLFLHLIHHIFCCILIYPFQFLRKQTHHILHVLANFINLPIHGLEIRMSFNQPDDIFRIIASEEQKPCIQAIADIFILLQF